MSFRIFVRLSPPVTFGDSPLSEGAFALSNCLTNGNLQSKARTSKDVRGCFLVEGIQCQLEGAVGTGIVAKGGHGELCAAGSMEDMLVEVRLDALH